MCGKRYTKRFSRRCLSTPTSTCRRKGSVWRAGDFLKKFLVCAPSNKVFTFGGDLRAVEMVVGHSILARQGITLALAELVEEGWLSLDDALNIVEPIMHGNAHKVFNLAQKYEVLNKVRWA